MLCFSRVLLLAVMLAALTDCAAQAASRPAPRTLAPPVLQEPASGATVEQADVFAWKSVRGAARYQYQISASSRFGSTVLGTGDGGGAGTTVATATALNKAIPDGRYFWRVRTIDARARAGRWSKARRFTKDWSTPPVLLAPTEDFGVTWPTNPLVLRWSSVPYAFDYAVTIATDPDLASPVLGGTAKPVRTRGTAFALPDTLPPGRYYWAIRPFDINGNTGRVSRVGSFTWSWPSATATRVTDLNPAVEVYDPQFSWDPVPGAATYEVEVNAAQDWASGSKVCCGDPVTGTSLSPTRTFENNRYYWRVRAVDDAGVSGQWNVGPAFEKTFDNVAPSINNLRVRDAAGEVDVSGGVPDLASPIVTWDPVPGASSYEVQVTPLISLGCDWGRKPREGFVRDLTAGTSWAPMNSGSINSSPGPKAWGAPKLGEGVAPGETYCARVLARSDRPGGSDNGFVSTWTYVRSGGSDAAFRFVEPDPGTPTAPFVVPEASYRSPARGSAHGRLPLFTWAPVPGARGYYVVVSNDPDFTTVTDYAYVRINAYAPGSDKLTAITYPDETTSYYWTVLPAANANGTGSTAQVGDGHTTTVAFEKESRPPELLTPAPGSLVDLVPTFRWTPAEGARRYRLQVAQDPTFATLLDDVATASTAYTSSTAYPADTALHWRVQMLDENDVGMSWSATGTFRRRLPVPAVLGQVTPAGSGIPILSFTPLIGAVSYDVHVEQSDGRPKDFTISSPVFTPTAFFGSGVFTWRARATFATAGRRKVSGGYFVPQSFVRTIPAPTRVVGTRTSKRMEVAWSPVPAAKQYLVELAATNDFSGAMTKRTATTAVVFDTASAVARTGGKLYWRVQALDEGNAAGTAATGTFSLPKGIKVSVTARLRRGVTSKVSVRLTDTRGGKVSKATVRVKGAGLRSLKRTSSTRGRLTLRLRPRRRGTVTLSVSKLGYRGATVRIRVG